MWCRTITLSFYTMLFANQVSSSGSAAYDYKLSGSDWGAEYSLCATGKEQSPIDLNDSLAKKSDTIALRGFNYPNYISQTLNRNTANTLPTDINSEFEVTFDDGHKQNFYPL